MFKITTGHAGYAHITSDDLKAIMLSIFGKNSVLCLAPWADNDIAFDYDLLTNNLIRIKSGLLVDRGCIAGINVNDYQELEIENGTQGMKRKDLLVAHYTRTAEDIEDFSLEIITGTPAEDNPQAPEIVTGNLAAGDREDMVALYEINIVGINVDSVERQYTTAQSILR